MTVWLHGSLKCNWGLNNCNLQKNGFMVMGEKQSQMTGTNYIIKVSLQRILCQNPGSTSTLFSEFGFPFFKKNFFLICFMHSPWGVMYNQWWSDAPCWRQVGQTARCPGSYDGVHLSGKWPRRVELYCSLTAARSVWEAMLQYHQGQNNVL